MKLLLLPLALLLGHPTPNPPKITLKGYFACQSHLIEATGDALITYARTQRDCRNGEVILAFEKNLSKRNERAVFEIVDTVHIKTTAASNTLYITSCTAANGKTQQYFVLANHTADNPKQLRSIRRVWGVNAQNQLVPVPAKTIKCLNPDYGAD